MTDERRRKPLGVMDAAEAVFKPPAPKPVEPVEPVKPRPNVPGARELVSLRIDQDVLEHFREQGPGWQERLNDALRRAAGL